MTAEECVQMIKARGIEAELWRGIPFIPASAVPTLEDKRKAIALCVELGLSAEISSIGMVLRRS